ncbi:ABC transporter ATP-binding protein [Superficieibacter sp. HKU1]|uniref:ABC transporter ATP-binding protein n=1 Tax=Superficieibacter sp. HKU1 TaxID=3031919 RepID=UPI0023E2CE3F|nr:ABC transporter ATP-binding protein [Superficieibacter sp. HKU1]WES68343.1 ABC transporter ATP-binding protein [Superficieibacter sp. HKU1]
MKNYILKVFSSLSYVRRLANIISNIKLMLALAFIAGVIKFSAPLLITIITSRVIDNIIMDESLTSSQRIILLVKYVMIVIIVFVLIWAPSTYYRQYLTELITVKITSRLREKVTNHIFSLPFSFFQEKQSGEINSRIISDVNLVATLVSGGLVYVWIDLASIAVVAFLVFYEDPFVGGISLLFIPLYVYLMKYFRDLIKVSSYKIQSMQGDFSAYIQDRLSNIETIRNYNSHDVEAENTRKLVNGYEHAFLKRSRIKSFNLLIMGQLSQLPSVIILALGGYEVITGGLTIGAFIALTMYIRQIFWPLDRVAEFNVNFAAATASLDRIYQILDVESERCQSHLAIGFPVDFSTITFNNVFASYNLTDKFALYDISFSIKKGEIIAIAGPSGSGKTTLARLLERTIACRTGEIFIDNININHIDLVHYRKNIKVVPQNPLLFSDTIKMNISYQEKNIPVSQLYQACSRAGALDFILSFPLAFNYHVGERGDLLSGGQRQRVAISRALASRSEIYIFDESTANLDTETERSFYEMLRKLRGKYTIIIIAHRPAVFDYVDRAILINEGRLEHEGTPEYLRNCSPLFRKLAG